MGDHIGTVTPEANTWRGGEVPGAHNEASPATPREVMGVDSVLWFGVG